MNELKILHLEDNKTDADLIARELRRAGMKIISKVVDTREDFDRELKTFQPDVVLSDHNLQEFNSVDAIRIFKKHQLSIPFILVTGSVSEEFAVAIMKEGADDYILKLNLTRLPTAIRHALDKKRLERERQLATERLYQKHQELQNLIYRCSHDLKAPLTSLLGLVNLSKQQEISPVMAKNLEMMEKSISKLDLILKGFMEYAKIMNEEAVIKEISFEPLVAGILQSLENMSGFKEVKIVGDIQQSKGFPTNEDAMHTILQNLIHNAVLYRRKNTECRVNISIRAAEDEAVIEIKDNGKGIPEKIQDKVFDMFFRGDSETEGSGLGLYLVKNAVTRLNGTITMTSKVGEGTAFKIMIPAASEGKTA